MCYRVTCQARGRSLGDCSLLDCSLEKHVPELANWSSCMTCPCGKESVIAVTEAIALTGGPSCSFAKKDITIPARNHTGVAGAALAALLQL